MPVNTVIDEKLNMLPAAPGVYIMKDAAGRVIYVGKAVSLRSRVRSYFAENPGQGSHGDKIKALVKNIRDLEWILTDSEIEALILECNLIKKHKPKYNAKLVDDKGYPYVRISVEDFPKVEYVQRMEKDGARYFGPYTSRGDIRETLKLMKRIFPIRGCSSTAGWGAKQRPCLNRHIGRCLAPCTGLVSKEVYGEIIRQVTLFLDGRQEALRATIEEKMEKAADDLNFEEAALLRDQLSAIRRSIERQKIVTDKNEDYDVINYARGKSKVCVQVFFVREGKLIGREAFFVEGAQDDEDVLMPFLQQYYSMATTIPPEILIPQWSSSEAERGAKVADGADDVVADGADGAGVANSADGAGVANSAGGVADAVGAYSAGVADGADGAGVANSVDGVANADGASNAAAADGAGDTDRAVTDELATTQAWLTRIKGRKVQIKTPKRGERKGLLEMVGKNARDLLLQNERHDGGQGDRINRGLEEIMDALGLESLPRRMECYDISHTSGTETVASMVVSIDGKPSPEHYRRFKIKTVEGNDDFASMAEVIFRRFSKEKLADSKFGELPDLVIIDGGKGQLSSARSIMELMGVGHIATVGLAKQFEWIYKPGMSDPIILDAKSPAIHLLQTIRDEAHRFAVTYHRLLRGRRNLASALDDIPGLGPKGKKALLDAFQLSLKNIMAAGLEELEATPGLSKKTAGAVYNWFHPAE